MAKQYKVVITKIIGEPVARLTAAKALKILKSITLSEALDLIEGVPSTVYEGPKAEADWLVSKLRQTGINVNLEEIVVNEKHVTCPECKTEISDKTKFCPECGYPIVYRGRMKSKNTEELLKIWKENDRKQWSEEAFEVIKQLLLERGETPPTQVAHQKENSEQSTAESSDDKAPKLFSKEQQNMDKKQILGLIGSIILFIGVFAPFISFPLTGSINYFGNGRGDGTIVLILALVSFILTIKRQYKGLWYTGLGSLGILAYTFITFQVRMSQTRIEMQRELADNPFAGIAEIAMQSVQLQWGLPVLIVGAALVVAAAAIKEEPK